MTRRDEDLIARIAQGDAEAFERLYEAYRKPIANMLYRFCFDSTLVEDLLQEVFVRVWRAAPEFRGEAKVSTFIFRVAYNVWYNEARRRKEKLATEGPEKADDRDPVQESERRETGDRLRAAIKELPEGERAVLILSEYNNQTYEEISRILGIPVGTVKSRMFHALQRLRKLMRTV